MRLSCFKQCLVSELRYPTAGKSIEDRRELIGGTKQLENEADITMGLPQALPCWMQQPPTPNLTQMSWATIGAYVVPIPKKEKFFGFHWYSNEVMNSPQNAFNQTMILL